MLLGHLLAQILQHREELLVGGTALAHLSCHSLLLTLLLVVVVVECDGDSLGHIDILTATIVNRDQAVVLDTLVDKAHNKSLTHNSSPELGIVLLALTEELNLVVGVALHLRRNLTRQNGTQMVNLKLIANSLERLQSQLHSGLGIDLGLGIDAVIAATAVLLGVLLAKVVEQRLATAE